MTAQEFAQVIEKYVEPFTVMLAITTTKNPTADHIITNGTGTLLYTGVRELLVTNHHVYGTFLACREETPHTRLVMSGAH